MPWIIRDALVTDAEAIADVHIRAWRAAYRGVFADDVLDGVDGDTERLQTDRAQTWRERLEKPPRDLRTLVVSDEGGTVVGFASIGPDRDGLGVGELYAINLRPDVWGKGAGRTLLANAVRALGETGHSELVLWVVRSNARARRFYEIAGWRSDGAAAQREVTGAKADEVRYRLQLR